MLSPVATLKGSFAALALTLVALLSLIEIASAAIKIRDGPDPSIMIVDGQYYSSESAGGGIWVRRASSAIGLGDSNVSRIKVWTDPGLGEVWAPEITTDGGRTYIYFAAGTGAAHRMYVISADSPQGTYSTHQKLALPDDRWAIDGTMFAFEGQRYFVWSGWAGTENVEQNLYICRMSNPTTPIGIRFIISQPRESWENVGDHPLINEGPEAIVDPNGQLHIVYSANGSWGSKYCLADLRLRKGGDATYVWDWYKSNGCLFGSHQEYLMSGWEATKEINGPGHHTFNLTNGQPAGSPGGTGRIPFVFHGVIKGEEYNWGNRDWFAGSFQWRSGTTYRRANVPGPNTDVGYSFQFFES